MIAAALGLAVGVFTPAPCEFKGAAADFEQLQRVECGWVAVPLRREAPEGKTIRLWTARLRATGAKAAADPVVYINGGPGIATVEVIAPAIAGIKSLAQLRESRDIILFDQRGSGRSEEALCPALAPALDAIEAQGLAPAEEDARSRAAFAECRAQAATSGADLEAYTTRATVHDLEVLRRAFGASRWNLLAISYGTLVAMDAMRETPSAIRSVILNSPYPPNSVAWAEQASGTAEAYRAIDRACAAQPACGERFGSVSAKLEATLARLEQAPLADGP